MAAFNEGMSRRAWTPEEEAMLGRDTAPQVAVKIGRTVAAVRRRRHQLGIRPMQASAPCEQCGQSIPSRKAHGRIKRFCDECASARIKASSLMRQVEYRRRNPEHYSGKQRRLRLLNEYGLTVGDYDRMLAAQGGVCNICGAAEPDSYKRRFYVDHDHNSGAVRALLCGACNMGIGQLKDDPALLRRAADYIERHRLRVVAGGRRVI